MGEVGESDPDESESKVVVVGAKPLKRGLVWRPGGCCLSRVMDARLRVRASVGV